MRNSSFAEMMKNRGQGIQQVQKKIEEETNKTNRVDERIWKTKPDAAGNYTAVIRFLPASSGETSPYVEKWDHYYQDNDTKKWYVENCPTTLGRACPVCEANTESWNTGTEAGKKLARDRKRNLSYYSNILVVKDPSNPENEGKVFIYRYGKKIFEKILAKVKPSDSDIEEPVDIFDFLGGADFVIKQKKLNGYVNYDDSYFKERSELFGGDMQKLEDTWNKQYPLEPFADPSVFKSYEELKEKFEIVSGLKGKYPTGNQSAEQALNDASNEEETPTEDAAPFEPTKQAAPKPVAQEAEEDDPLARFKSLMED